MRLKSPSRLLSAPVTGPLFVFQDKHKAGQEPAHMRAFLTTVMKMVAQDNVAAACWLEAYYQTVNAWNASPHLCQPAPIVIACGKRASQWARHALDHRNVLETYHPDYLARKSHTFREREFAKIKTNLMQVYLEVEKNV